MRMWVARNDCGQWELVPMDALLGFCWFDKFSRSSWHCSIQVLVCILSDIDIT